MRSIILIAITSLTLASCKDREPSQDEIDLMRKFAAENAVKVRLRDPDSAQFSDEKVVGKVVCGYVNSKNSFGGYAGKKRFVSAGVAQGTFFESDTKEGDFDQVWAQLCY